VPPTISAQPVSQTVSASSNATFSVTATGTTPLSYQWRFNGNPITGATSATLTLSNVQTNQAGNYSVVITNVAGAITSSVASLTVVGGPVGFALRQLPAGYSPSGKFIVTITTTPVANVGVYAVEDAPPVGWTVGTINNSGSFDVLNGRVKFGPFFDSIARTLTYELTPPANATGIHTFAGTASADGVNSAIGGTPSIDLAPRHPADNNPADGRITIGEVTAYGSAWKTGATWPLAPNPIPISYVTRAGALWKGGETYRFDPMVTNAPLWWVNTGGVAPQGLRSLGVAPGGLTFATVAPGVATAELAGGFQRNKDFTVTLRVRPAVGVGAYAVEETVPLGWNVKLGSLDQGGSYDSTSRKVKWGPFFDTVERAFTFLLEPGSNGGPVVFTGVASFDGVDVGFSGRRGVPRAPFLPENVNAGRNVKVDGFRVVVQGEAGKRYDIEATETPGIPGSWVAVATNLDGAALMDFTDSLAAGRAARFYRVIER